jgi:SAM-dependent methyltransferase
MAVRWARPPRGGAALDVCCGSGDLALELAAAVGGAGTVVGLDFAQEMLDDAAAREGAAAAARPAARRAAAAPVTWVRGDALALPFADASFDAATVGYGLRNVSDVPRALAELARVLRPGGTVAVLDFNNAEDGAVDALQARARTRAGAARVGGWEGRAGSAGGAPGRAVCFGRGYGTVDPARRGGRSAVGRPRAAATPCIALAPRSPATRTARSAPFPLLTPTPYPPPPTSHRGPARRPSCSSASSCPPPPRAGWATSTHTCGRR